MGVKIGGLGGVKKRPFLSFQGGTLGFAKNGTFS